MVCFETYHRQCQDQDPSWLFTIHTSSCQLLPWRGTLTLLTMSRLRCKVLRNSSSSYISTKEMYRLHDMQGIRLRDH